MDDGTTTDAVGPVDVVDATKILVGAAGVLFSIELWPPGRYVLAAEPLALDVGLAVLVGFAFLSVWGVLGVVVRLERVRRVVEVRGDDATALAVVLALSLVAGTVAGLEADVTGLALLATVSFNAGLTMVVMTGLFLVLRRVGVWTGTDGG